MSDAFLWIAAGQKRLRVALDDQPVSIGRDPANRVAIDDGQLSRHHCVIERKGSKVTVTDLGSRNGTKVNGRKVLTADIEPGDVVKIGAAVMEVRIEGQAKAPRKPAAKPKPAPVKRHFDDELVSMPPDDEPAEAAPPPDAHAASPSPGGMTIDTDEAEASAEMHLNYNLNELRQLQRKLAKVRFSEKSIALINARGGAFEADDSRGPTGETVLRLLLLICLQTRATDLHIEPKNHAFDVRLRVDGTMVSLVKLHRPVGDRLQRVVKVLTDIDLTQLHATQDGHFSAAMPDRRVDYRVSFAPVVHGQKLVVRVLDLMTSPQKISDLGLPQWMEAAVRQTIPRQAGMILVSGPTGSGKTTTLYSIIRDINAQQRNIITIEDPVEYQIEGVTQIPIDLKQGNTFTTLLRSVLRQDPDVILLGEIRDAETARIAAQAAATGHLVLSTVHAKDAIGVFFRLMDLGVEPQLLASALNLIMSQRLARQLCPHCKKPVTPSFDERRRMGKPGETVKQMFVAAGCAQCLNTGYVGRRGLYELLSVSQDVRDVLLSSPTIRDLRRTFEMANFQSLAQCGIQLVIDGVTSLDEVDRVAAV